MTIEEKVQFLKSYTNEAWYYEYMLQNEKDEKRKELIIKKINDTYAYIVAQDSNLHQL